MLAYAFIDPVSAMNSQRVFAERQHPNGYINYRTGAYLDEVIEEKGELTSSAPWYSWLNWEVFRITKDTAFLREMYQSSRRFYRFYTSNRDKDHDGLCEWGGEAILESVRDALVAVWDKVGYPAEFESVDLNCMLVMEAKALEKMAKALHLDAEAREWKKDYRQRTALINKTFWDPETQFYYNVDKRTHDFSYKNKDDLKRKEIIGFLPLWAGVANKKQAAALVKELTDTSSFWRRYGVPSLAADDPYYNPRGYWNGPVWIQWDYLIERGLLDYGYKSIARDLVHKVADNMLEVLKKDHELWEFYDPDSVWGGYHRAYIWAGIINRMMMDVQ
jgi:glycogen debranching enzyme